MKRSPKQRGTEAEVMARNFLADDGWTDCERIVQHGAHDQGDLLVCRNPRIIAEVKGGAQAEAADRRHFHQLTHSRALRNRRSQGEASPHSRGCQLICELRKTRSGCGIRIVMRPSAAE